MVENAAERVREMFDALVELSADARQARLAELVGDAPELAARVRRLLDAHDRASSFGSIIEPDGKPAVPPETIGPYRLLDRLGEGGMGMVYLAEQRQPVKRRVAIKVIRPGMANREVIKRFEAERQALALMTHPGIARILDAGETEQGLPYFVMEFVRGVPLLRYCEQRRLSIRERVKLMQQVCHAVQHAHQKGVIHRDLKPSNILVTEESSKPQAKIIDFGIAKAVAQPLTDATLHTRAGIMVGTPDYMSPEQCNSGNVDIDTRSDVYSLGAMLYEVLSGRLPFDFNRRKLSEPEILLELRDLDPPPLSKSAHEASEDDWRSRGYASASGLQRELHGELEWIAAKALARERGRRYDSAQALADDLERYLENLPLVAGPPTLRYRMATFVRRHTLGVSVVSLSFLVLGVFSAFLAWQVHQTELERDRANIEAQTATEVTRFLVDIFDSAEPNAALRKQVTARELLDAAYQRMRSDESIDGEVRVRLLYALGEAYGSLAIGDQAEAMLEAALDAYERHELDAPTLHFRILADLSYALTATGQTREARRRLEQTLPLLDTGLDIDPYREVEVMGLLSSVYARMGRRDAAIETARELVTFSRDRFGEEHPNTFGPVAQLIWLLWESLRADEAQRWLDEILPLSERVLGKDAYLTRYLRGTPVIYLSALGRYEEAARVYRPLYEAAVASSGHEAWSTQMITGIFASAQPDPQRGLELIDGLLERYADGAEGNSELVPDWQLVRAELLARLGDRTRALAAAEAALAAELRRENSNAENQSDYFLLLAKIHSATGKIDKAIELLGKVTHSPIRRFRLLNDPEFAAVRGDFRFPSILERIDASRN